MLGSRRLVRARAVAWGGRDLVFKFYGGEELGVIRQGRHRSTLVSASVMKFSRALSTGRLIEEDERRTDEK
jgi:hypothetical protein